MLLTDQAYPRVRVTFGGYDSFREPLEIEAEEFVGVKGFKAHGKRVSTWNIESVEELEPTRLPEKEDEDNDGEDDEESIDEGDGKEQEQNTPKEERPHEEKKGQLNLFEDEE